MVQIIEKPLEGPQRDSAVKERWIFSNDQREPVDQKEATNLEIQRIDKRGRVVGNALVPLEENQFWSQTEFEIEKSN